MQRALGGDFAPFPSPGPHPSSSKQKIPALPSATKLHFRPQKPSLNKSSELQKSQTLLKTPVAKIQPVESTPKPTQAKLPLMEDKQMQSRMQNPTSGTVPTLAASKTKQDAPGNKAISSQMEVMNPQRSETSKPLQHAVSTDFKTSPQLSQQIHDSKATSQPWPSLDAKAQMQAEMVEIKESSKKIPPHLNLEPDIQQDHKERQTSAGQKSTPCQPQALSQKPQMMPESSVGGITDAFKPQSTTPQETMTGKLFGFGVSIFSQASSLISTGGQPGAQPSGPPTGLPSKQLLPPTQSASQKDVQPSPKAKPEKHEQFKVEAHPPVKEAEGGKKSFSGRDTKAQIVTAKASVQEPSLPAAACPLCKTALNMGSKDHSNYQKCTECKNVVCNLCGFNPMPHITEVSKALILLGSVHNGPK